MCASYIFLMKGMKARKVRLPKAESHSVLEAVYKIVERCILANSLMCTTGVPVREGTFQSLQMWWLSVKLSVFYFT